MLLALSSCTNLDDLYRRLDEHDSRLKKLETLNEKANATMEAMQQLLDAQASKVGIVSFAPTADGMGYILNMSDGSTITLANGKDGLTPAISFAQDIDGYLYWTLNGQFMLDALGNKIKAEGKDGISPLAPKMRVNTAGNWEISNDGGKTWSEIKDANGKPVKADNSAAVDLTITEDAEGNITIKYNGQTFVIGKNSGGTTPPEEGGGETPVTKSIVITDATTAGSINLTITPSDNEMTYFWSALTKADYEQKLQNPANNTIFDFDKAWFAYQSEGTEFTWFDAMKKYLLTGVQTVNVLEETHVIIDDTDYMCWAYGLDDQGNLVTDITLKEVRTPKSTPTGNEFTVTVNQIYSDGVDATIIPTVKDDVFYVTLQKARYVQWWLDNSTTRDMAYQLIKDRILGNGDPANFSFSGDTHITPEDVSAGSSNTDYYIIIFSYTPENGVGSQVHLHPFKTARNS